MATQVNENLLRKIDELELSVRIQRWQKAMKSCPSQIYVDRQKLALESWKETEGEDIEIRRAKLFKKIVENVPIKIHDFDVLVGRLTPGVIGASTAMDIKRAGKPLLFLPLPAAAASNANLRQEERHKECLCMSGLPDRFDLS